MHTRRGDRRGTQSSVKAEGGAIVVPAGSHKVEPAVGAQLRLSPGPGSQDQAIDRNRVLAKEFGITGTPSFIVGTELVPGALGLNGLKELVARAGKQ